MSEIEQHIPAIVGVIAIIAATVSFIFFLSKINSRTIELTQKISELRLEIDKKITDVAGKIEVLPALVIRVNDLVDRTKALEIETKLWRERDHVPRAEYDRDRLIWMEARDELQRLSERVKLHLERQISPSD